MNQNENKIIFLCVVVFFSFIFLIHFKAEHEQVYKQQKDTWNYFTCYAYFLKYFLLWCSFDLHTYSHLSTHYYVIIKNPPILVVQKSFFLINNVKLTQAINCIYLYILQSLSVWLFNPQYMEMLSQCRYPKY